MRAALRKDQGAARPRSIRGPGISGSRRVVEADVESDGEMEENEVETRDDST
jgi:hypothetical protein